MKPILFTAISTVLFIASSSPVTAQIPAKGGAGKKPVVTAAMSFGKAGETWAQILADRKSLDEAIKGNQLAEAHDIVFSIRDGVVTLPYKSAALAPMKKNVLVGLVQRVATLAENIDKYADAGNAAKTKAEHAKLNTVLDAIESVYPANALPASGSRPMSAADKTLFLTPGGLYTPADIAANGNTSAYLKYASVPVAHGTKVGKGAAVCPISETQPNPKLTWTVGGKLYTFCCPPCIAEFVQKAKTDPASIKAPEEYIKK